MGLDGTGVTLSEEEWIWFWAHFETQILSTGRFPHPVSKYKLFGLHYCVPCRSILHVPECLMRKSQTCNSEKGYL